MSRSNRSAVLETDPYRVRRELEANRADHVYRVSSVEGIPDEIPLILGDALHNMHSTLDYLVFADASWVADNTGVPLTDPEMQRLQFPICLSSNEFKSQVGRGRIARIRPNVRALIEGVQPYLREKNWTGPYFLAFLKQFSVIDKHREFNDLFATARMFRHRNLEDFGDSQITTPPPGPFVHLEPGTELARFRFADPQPEVNVEPEFEFSIRIENFDLMPLVDWLNAFARFIEDKLIDAVTYP